MTKRNKGTYKFTILISLMLTGGFLSCEDDNAQTESSANETTTVSFTLTDTGQTGFYDDNGDEISEPSETADYYGQDAQFSGIASSFRDNNDGTVSDLNTGLMWQKTPDFERHNYYDAFDYVENLETGGYTDWRLPTIKELYSLLNSNGSLSDGDTENSQPYLYDEYFDFKYHRKYSRCSSCWCSSCSNFWK